MVNQKRRVTVVKACSQRDKNHDRGTAEHPALEGDMYRVEMASRSHARDSRDNQSAAVLAELDTLIYEHVTRFTRLDEISDLNKAITCVGQAVQLTPDGHKDKPMFLGMLLMLYICRSEKLGEAADIYKAIACSAQVIRLTLVDDADKQSPLCRFHRHVEPEGIDQTVHCQPQASWSFPDDHLHNPVSLNDLGNSYICRFHALGELSDVEKAVTYHLQAVQLTPDDDPNKPQLLNNLGWSYTSRFDRLGKLSDINHAIASQTQAIQLTPDGSMTKPRFLSNLGLSYAARYNFLGERPDVDEAVDCLIRAVQHTPAGHGERPKFLCNLGFAYARRFEQFGELPDNDNSIACLNEAVQLTPEGWASKSTLLDNLGSSYMRRYEKLGELANIEKAIDYCSQSVRLTPEGHPQKPRSLTNLATALACRFECLTGSELSDIDEAIEYQMRALELTPDNHVDKPMVIGEFGRFCFLRAKRLGNLLDFDNAIDCQSEAVQLIPDCHARKLLLLLDLGDSYLSRFHLQCERKDLEAASSTFQEAALFAIGRPTTRYNAARKWAKSCSLLGISPKPAHQSAMALIHQVIWLGIPINQRYDILAKIRYFTMEAASTAIVEGAYNLALEWLEQGRSVVWNQILQLRTPFDRLFSADQVLALRLKNLASELERAGSRRMSTLLTADHVADLEKDARHHRRLATEWDQLLEQTRTIDGFQEFLRPLNAKALIHAAKDGPIILINVNMVGLGCDALVIPPNVDNVAHVPLPNFSFVEALAIRHHLQSLFEHRSPRTRGLKLGKWSLNLKKKLKATLKRLWLGVVKPVLDFLGYTQEPPADPLPHVTWCTTGILSFLPLHAAGCYDGTKANTFDLVISSYTPTLSALLSSNSPNCTTSNSGILAVGQEHTKGLSALPNTRKELEVIEEHAKGISRLLLDDEKATVDAVLNAMEEYSCVHLACHASQNASDPSQSAFHLHDGSLMLSAITKRSFKNKGLAFLSACQTAAGDEKVPDEAVHLAAGMLMAGYPSVIATMWVIADEDAPEIARAVYAELIKDGKMDCTGASRALHKAVAGLREKVGEEAFERWVPFMHIGR